jgi:hypothetical protein
MFTCIVFCVPISWAQTFRINEDLLLKHWESQWITCSGHKVSSWGIFADPSLTNYGVFTFRKNYSLSEIPAQCLVHVSADNRYKLLVNGTLVSLGPLRGTVNFWNYETVDIAPYLNKGNNTISALVWNMAKDKPWAQISIMTAFILQADNNVHSYLNTDTSWVVRKENTFSPLHSTGKPCQPTGAGDFVDFRMAQSSDSGWQKPRVLLPGAPKAAYIDSWGWMLVPSPFPQMELKIQKFKAIRQAEGITIGDGNNFLNGKMLSIPSHNKVKLLIDQGELTNAYPFILFSKGKNASITLDYAESLYIPDNKAVPHWNMGKGNRNEIGGKIFASGKMDSLISNGGERQNFTSLWWRTFRYIQLIVETHDEPLEILDFYSTFTGFPFVVKASFESSDPLLTRILDVGWHTARLCAVETFMDCPYYEQLQYVGDSRIQAMVSLYYTGDDRMFKNALNMIDESRKPEGITQCRYPSFHDSYIPTFSLWYIGMLHDYWLYGKDPKFVKGKMAGMRCILDYFFRLEQVDGSLKKIPYWAYTDWVRDWEKSRGVPPVGKDGCSSVLDAQWLWTLQLAAELENKLGYPVLAQDYLKKATLLKQTIKRKYWDEKKGLFADTKEHNSYSQHANSLAILAGLTDAGTGRSVGQKIVDDKSLTQASIYFKYYVNQALCKAGLGNDYLKNLDIWKENLDMGLTTWAETSNVSASRSDCHAWGSSPNIEFFRIVLGIESVSEGFERVKVTPHLSYLENAGCSIPHPKGTISTSYQKKNGRWNILIKLPSGVSGTFVWDGKVHPIKGGPNVFNLK